jgi:hypothetical protein
MAPRTSPATPTMAPILSRLAEALDDGGRLDPDSGNSAAVSNPEYNVAEPFVSL